MEAVFLEQQAGQGFTQDQRRRLRANQEVSHGFPYVDLLLIDPFQLGRAPGLASVRIEMCNGRNRGGALGQGGIHCSKRTGDVENVSS